MFYISVMGTVSLDLYLEVREYFSLFIPSLIRLGGIRSVLLFLSHVR